MTRCMSRPWPRSGLPVWYTQGFNPHIYMTFALPLSLGVESRAETMDFRLEEELPFDQVAARLNACLPEGIRVLWAGEPVEKPEAIAWAEYAVRLTYDGGEAGEMGKAPSGPLGPPLHPGDEAYQEGAEGDRHPPPYPPAGLEGGGDGPLLPAADGCRPRADRQPQPAAGTAV